MQYRFDFRIKATEYMISYWDWIQFKYQNGTEGFEAFVTKVTPREKSVKHLVTFDVRRKLKKAS